MISTIYFHLDLWIDGLHFPWLFWKIDLPSLVDFNF